MKKATLTTLIVFLTTFSAWAVKVQLFESISGSSINGTSTLPTLTDDYYGSLPATPGFVNYKVKNRLVLGIDHTSNIYVGTAFRYRFNITIFCEDANLDPFQKDIDLDVTYDPFTSGKFNDISVFEFEGAHKMDVTINSITDLNTSNSITDPEDILYIKSEMEIERYFDFNAAYKPSMLVIYNGATNEYGVSWNAVTGAEEYDLEWTFVNDYSQSGSSYLPSSSLMVDFRYNSTRITTKELSYNISNVFDHGYVVFRLRAIGRNQTYPDKEIVGAWSDDPVGNVSSFSAFLQNTTVYEGNKNWQYSTQYAEEGKKKEVIGFYDGSLRSRQQVTKVNTTDKIIVGESIYDFQGRKAIDVLPVPVTTDVSDQRLRYYENFNLNTASTPVVYSASDFDTDNGSNCESAPGEMSPDAGASRYYSPNNPDQSAQQKFLPEAENRPYIQTVYTPDNTGRVAIQSAPGAHHYVTTGHETKYFYGAPLQPELDRLFGSEAGYAAHYKKNMVIDPNGQISISYLDQQGRVVATALAGNAPTNVQQIASYGSSTRSMDVDLLAKDANGKSVLNTPDASERALVFNSALLVTTAGVYQFDYTITPDKYTESCLPANICFDCIYDLNITVYDDCGQPVFSINERVGKPELNTDCDDPVMQFVSDDDLAPGSFNLSLGVGKYNIVKILKVNEEAFQYYLQQYLDDATNTCLKPLSEFIDEEKEKLDYSGCEISCEDCVAKLGSKDAFVLAEKGTEKDWELAYEECLEPCKNTSACEALRIQMVSDMSPGGQYAELDDPETGEPAPYKFPLSVFNYGNVLPDRDKESNQSDAAYWRNPRLEREDGSIVAGYYEEDGITRSVVTVQLLPDGSYFPAIVGSPMTASDGSFYVYPEDLLHEADFRFFFSRSWANSLVIYHPEYCYLQWCKGNQTVTNSESNSSEAFDEDFLSTYTYADAQTKGYLSPNTVDPYFLAGGRGAGQTAAISASMNNFFRKANGTYLTMQQLAALMTRCPNNHSDNFDASCLNFGTGSDVAILDAEWNKFKSFYHSAKGKLQIAAAHDWVINNPCGAVSVFDKKSSYNACIGDDNFNPFNSQMYDVANAIDPFHSSIITYWDFDNKNYSACEFETFLLYKNKVKRFMDSESDLNADPEKAEFNAFYFSGVCPVASEFQLLLNGIAEDGLLLSTTTLNDYSFFTPRLYKSILGISVDPNVYPKVRVTGSVSGYNLKLVFEKQDVNNIWTPISCETELRPVTNASSVNWSQVLAISRIKPSTTHGVILEASYDHDNNSGTDPVVIELYIATCFDIIGCQFADQCYTTDLAKSLEILMSALANAGKLNSTTPVFLNDPASTAGTFLPFTSDYLRNEFNGNPNLYWSYNVFNQNFRVYITGGTPEELILTPNSSDIAGIPLSSIKYFSDTRVNPNNVNAGVIMKVHYYTSGGQLLSRDIRFNSSREGILGYCKAPVPITCESKEHMAATDLQNLLHYVFSAGGINTNISTNNSLTSTLKSYLGNGGVTLTNVVESRDLIEADIEVIPTQSASVPCKLSVFRIHPFYAQMNDLRDIDEVLNDPVKLLTETALDGKYYGFRFKVKFLNGLIEEIGVRTSCIPVKACETCEEDPSPCLSAYSRYTDAVLSFNAGTYGNNPIVSGTSREHSLTVIPFSEFNCICPYPYDEYLRLEYVQGEQLLTYQQFIASRCFPNPCDSKYDEYVTSVQLYNAAHPSATINVEPKGADFPCACVENYITYLDGFIATTEIPVPYSISKFCCGTEQDWATYVTNYNNSKHPNDPNIDLPSNQWFGGDNPLCLCLEKYKKYLEAVTAYNNRSDIASAGLFIQPEEYSGAFECNCVSSYIDYLETFSPVGHPAREIQDFCCNDYTNYQSAVIEYNNAMVGGSWDVALLTNDNTFPLNCGCTASYEDYLQAILAYNQNHVGEEIIPMSYQDFDDYCYCVEDYIYYLSHYVDPLINEQAVSIAAFCCFDYKKYNELTGLYNTQYSPDLILRQYDNEFRCDCALDYNSYLEAVLYYNSIVVLTANGTFIEAVDIITSGDCPCWADYASYLVSVADHNLYYPNAYITPVDWNTFKNDLLCNQCYVNYSTMIYLVAEYNNLFNTTLDMPILDNNFNCDCEGDYFDYIDAVTQFNILNFDNPTVWIEIIPYDQFDCDCGIAYANYINEYINEQGDPELLMSFSVFMQDPDRCETYSSQNSMQLSGPGESQTEDLFSLSESSQMLFSQSYPSEVIRKKRVPCPLVLEPPVTEEIVDRCAEELDFIAEENAKKAREEYLKDLTTQFRKAYFGKCLQAQETFDVTFTDREHHYTLYYYDQAGNLVRTIPPAGVVPVTSSNELEQIIADRTFGNQTFFTSHTLQTVYEYNSLNQLIKQSVPDHDKMEKWDIMAGNLGGLLPVGAEVVDIRFVSAQKVLVLANQGSDGYILKSEDGGNSWSLLNMSTPDLKKVYMATTSTGYAIGEEGLLLKTTDGGLKWRLIYSATTGMTLGLKDLYFINSNTGVVVGANGTIKRTINGGSSWTTPTGLPAGADYTGISFKNTTDGMVVMNVNGEGQAYKSTDGGASWTSFNTFRPVPITAAHFFAANNGYAGGEYGFLMKTTDGGATWTQVYTGLPDDIKQLYFNNSGNGIALLANGDFYHTNDAGLTWNQVSVLGTYKGFHFYSSTDGFAVGEDGLMAQLSLGTSSASVYKISNFNISINNDLLSAHFISATEGIIGGVGATFYKASYNNTLRKMTLSSVTVSGGPSGKDFVKVYANNNTSNSEQKGVVLCHDGTIYKYATSSGKTSFTFSTFTITSAKDFTYTNNYLYLTFTYFANVRVARAQILSNSFSDPGASVMDHLKSGQDGDPIMITAFDDSRKWVFGQTGTILKYNFTGGTIDNYSATLKPLPFREIGTAVVASTNHRFSFAVGDKGTLFRWEGTETDWEMLPTRTHEDLNDAWPLHTNSVLVVAGNKGTLLTSNDGGATLAHLSGLTTENLYGIGRGGGSAELMVVGAKGTILGGYFNNIPAGFSVKSTPAGFESVDLYGVHGVSTIGFIVGQYGKTIRCSTGFVINAYGTNMLPLLNDIAVTGNSGLVGANNGCLLKSTDGANSWSLQAQMSPFNHILAVEVRDDNKQLVSGENSFIRYTLNNGDSWSTPTGIAGGLSLADMLYVNDNEALLAAGPGIYRSTDGGLSWGNVLSTGGAAIKHLAQNITNSLAVGTGGAVYRSTNEGASWSAVTHGLSSADLLKVEFYDNLTAYASGNSGFLMKTTDGGLSWSSKNAGLSTNAVKGLAIQGRGQLFTGGLNPVLNRIQDESDYLSSIFWYDELGRIVVSQNTKQFNKDTAAYSYTVYDALGRITEVGENFSPSDANTILSSNTVHQISNTLYPGWISAGVRREITKTYYDLAFAGASGLIQENLRKRVASITYEYYYDGNDLTFDHGTHYTYDIHGNVGELVQHNRALAGTIHEVKRIKYTYDLISGLVKQLAYNEGAPDQYYHRYQYDADNRILSAQTSRNGYLWDEDARYKYYDHGPLARVEVGNNGVQGIDYAYTLQGWIKGVNSTSLQADRDMGLDGKPATSNEFFARDLFGFALNYYSGDYSDIALMSSTDHFLASTANTGFLNAHSVDLYNGNISSMATSITLGGVAKPQLAAYRYDQLNRLIEMHAMDDFDDSHNEWNSSYTNRYTNLFSYDANGNILTQSRADQSNVVFDNLEYQYAWANPSTKTGLVSNRLYHVDDDPLLGGNKTDDIDDQGTFDPTLSTINSTNNYAYDELGNLKQDLAEDIEEITWNLSGKISRITRKPTSTRPDLEFRYDAMGNRVEKIVIPANGGAAKHTYYVRDPLGQELAIYNRYDSTSTEIEGYNIYGSTRVGMDHNNDITQHPMIGADSTERYLYHFIGNKEYEGSNHLGNVLSTFTDNKIPQEVAIDGIIDYYLADQLTATDYSPFGAVLEGRKNASQNKYRRGFQSAERDDEIKGNGSSLDFGARIYDSRLGRFLSIDPLFKIYPEFSPYAFCANNPIIYKEDDGRGFNGGFSVENQSSKPIVVVGTSKTITTDANGNKVETESPATEVTLQPGERLEVYYTKTEDANGKVTEKYTAKVVTASDGKVVKGKEDVNAWDVDFIKVQEGETFVDEGFFTDDKYNIDPNDKDAKIPNPPTGEGTIKLQPGVLSHDLILSKDDANKGRVTISGDSDNLKISTSGDYGYTPSVDYGDGKEK